jgi:hypothetical protein
MPPSVRTALTQELARARACRTAADLDAAFAHLERAHILSQRFAFAHAGVHLRMWRIGWLRGDLRELVGQTTRTLAALIFSRVWVPVGNTGGADVSAFRPMPLPADLKALLEASD